MDQLQTPYCGLDIHKRSVVACVLQPQADGTSHKETRTVGTTVPDLAALQAWISATGCTHVGMEATGVYWKPVCAA